MIKTINTDIGATGHSWADRDYQWIAKDFAEIIKNSKIFRKDYVLVLIRSQPFYRGKITHFKAAER